MIAISSGRASATRMTVCPFSVAGWLLRPTGVRLAPQRFISASAASARDGPRLSREAFLREEGRGHQDNRQTQRRSLNEQERRRRQLHHGPPDPDPADDAPRLPFRSGRAPEQTDDELVAVERVCRQEVQNPDRHVEEGQNENE